MPSHNALVLLAAALLSACGKPADVVVTHIDTLPNGAVRVRSDAPRWKTGEGWKVTQDLAIGGADTGASNILDVRGIAADAAGRIYILDASVNAVQVFDAAGNYLRTVGRKGGGPGEFAGPIGVALQQERLVVVDQPAMRLTLFDSSGTLIATHPRAAPSNIGVGAWEGGVDRNGRIIDMAPQMVEGNPWGEWSLLALDSAYRAVDTFPLPQHTPKSTELVKKSAGGMSRTRMVLPNTPMLSWTLDPAGYVWFGVSDSYRIIQRTLEGDTVRIIERTWTPPPLSDSAAARSKEFAERLRKDGFTIFDHDLATTSPAFQELVVDDQGNLWVGEPGWPRRTWDVFDSTGVLLGPVEFPQPVRQLKFAHGHYYAVTRDADDVIQVVRGTVTR